MHRECETPLKFSALERLNRRWFEQKEVQGSTHCQYAHLVWLVLLHAFRNRIATKQIQSASVFGGLLCTVRHYLKNVHAISALMYRILITNRNNSRN